MTVQELVNSYKRNNPDGHYFDKEWLKFFGEKYSTMSIAKEPKIIIDYSNKEHTCWVLKSLQHPTSETSKIHISYFDVVSFEEVFNKDE